MLNNQTSTRWNEVIALDFTRILRMSQNKESGIATYPSMAL